MAILNGRLRIRDATSYFDRHRVTRILPEDPLIVVPDAFSLPLVLYLYISGSEGELISFERSFIKPQYIEPT